MLIRGSASVRTGTNLGEAGGGGQAAYEQYREIAKLHPWVHPYYFENVTAHDEIGEDMALAVVPAAA